MRSRSTYPAEEFQFEDAKRTVRRKRKPVANGGLHDTASAAAKLKVTEEALRGFVKAGQLKFINIGQGDKRPRYRFTDADLSDFITARQSQESPSCQSSRPRSQRRISGSVSKSVVSDFMVRRAQQIASRLKK
jgi:hypothetical protein